MNQFYKINFFYKKNFCKKKREEEIIIFESVMSWNTSFSTLNRTLIQLKLNTTLPIYFSKEPLTTRIGDYLNFYFLPLVCAFGIVTSSINVIVLLKMNKLNQNVYL